MDLRDRLLRVDEELWTLMTRGVESGQFMHWSLMAQVGSGQYTHHDMERNMKLLSIGERLPELESAILNALRNSPEDEHLAEIAVKYAMTNKGGKGSRGRMDEAGAEWPEIEPYIMKHPEAASKYAAWVMRERWPEAEPYIMKHSRAATNYAAWVKKGRWPEAEPYIYQDEGIAVEYDAILSGESPALRYNWPFTS